MVSSCIAYGCTNRSKSGSGRSFFRFPLKKPELLAKWVQAIHRKNWSPNNHSRICSDHFDPSCLVKKPGKIGLILTENAVPSIFQAFPKHLQAKPKKERQLPKKRKLTDSLPLSSPSPSNVAFDHAYASKADVASKAKVSANQVAHLKQKVKALKQRVRRCDVRIRNLSALLSVLQKQKLVTNEQHDMLENNFSGVGKKLFQDQIQNAKSTHGYRYSTETKQFALTLHYYSPRAYNFVRRIFKLPHASNICKWNGSIDCEPGFLRNVIDFLGKQAKTDQTLQDCVLIVDAMAIRKGTWFDPKKGTYIYVGQVDYGGALLEEEDTLATEVLVFLLCGVSGHWKRPVAYFLQMKNSAEVLAHLTKDCVRLLQVSGLNVIALVFDGTYANQNTAKILGCKVSMECKKTWFTIPQNPSSRVHIIFDVCHMLKLVQNMFGDMGTLQVDEKGVTQPIRWKYIDALNDVQENLGLSMANKLASSLGEKQDESKTCGTNFKCICCNSNRLPKRGNQNS